MLVGAVLAFSCDAQDALVGRRFVTNERLILGTESQFSAAVRTGDLDGDGDPDLVVADGRHWPQQNTIYLNQSRARFNVARPLGMDRCTSYTCELADLDGDGDLDIAVANDNAPCLVFLNDGNARFTQHCSVGTPSSVRSLTATDVDGDEDIDLLFTCRGRPNRIHFNDGSANFDREVNFGTDNDSTIGVAVADLNSDGHQDLILANRDEQPNTILLGTGRWNSESGQDMFQPPTNFGNPKLSSRAVAVADLNGDGHVDWVMGNIGSKDTVYFGNGKGGVLRELAIGENDSRTYCIAIADLNNDGKPDIVSGNAGQANSVHFNNENSANQTEFHSSPFGASDSVTYGLCAGDFNGDGFLDIAVANSGQPNRIYLNQAQIKRIQQ